MHIEALRVYCLSLPQVTVDFPFDESTVVFRVGGKIFLLTDIDEGKSFNAKCNPERAIELRETHPDAIFPGYHMNKQHWNTVHLDMQLDPALLFDLIKHSYDLILKSLPAKKREELGL